MAYIILMVIVYRYMQLEEAARVRFLSLLPTPGE
jgi:hypothetical protein